MLEHIKIVIVEDEFAIALNIQSILETEGYNVVGIATNFKECMDFCREHKPHIVMMDIEIQGALDGIETAELIRDLFEVSIIFLTAYSQDEFFERAKKISPEAYLLKPFETTSLLRTVSLACTRLQEITKKENKGFIIVNSGDGWVKLRHDEIIYVQSDNNYCTFYLKNKKPLLINMTLKSILNNVPEKSFFRCHQSFIINLDFLVKVERDEGYFAVLDEEFRIPVSRSNKAILLEKFKK